MHRTARVRVMAGFTVGIVLLLVLAVGPTLARAGHADRPSMACGSGQLRGTYAVHGSGEVLGAPFALVGRLTFTADGRVTGQLSETKLLVGNVERTTLAGTWSLDERCHGEMAIRVTHEDWVDHHTFDLYVAAGGRTFSWILTSTWFDHLDLAGATIDLDPAGLNEAIVGAMTADRHGGAVSGLAERF